MAPVSGATSAEANYPNSTEPFPPFGQIIIPLSRVRLSGFPPDVTCAVFGFLFNQFDLTQSVIVMFTDFNAFSMIVLATSAAICSISADIASFSSSAALVIGSSSPS